ncbi:MAG: DUF2461 domain-containing protein [Bacteroidetes bacterium]|nr:DUF2461 domain-containing protein [Bacteroidota bacterium]
MEFPPFPGFRSQAFSFLKDLKEHNDRDWFNERKSVFEDELKWPMQCLVVDASRRFASEGIELTGDPKKSLFRIYRDTRFSKNKAPYKTHVAAVLSESGSTKEQGGVYIHVEPRNCFAASGFWDPDSKHLGQIRTRIAQNPGAFLELADHFESLGIPLTQRSEGLKRMPRGFEDYTDSEIADYLKWKSFIVVRSFTQKQLSTPDFTDEIVRFARDIKPLASL